MDGTFNSFQFIAALVAPESPAPLTPMFKDAATFPFRDGAWLMILLGAVFSALLTFASSLPILGLGVAVFSGGYFAAFYFEIISSTVTGHDRCPDWPSFSSFYDDILLPYFRVIGVVLLSFLPALACVFALDEESGGFQPAFWAAVGFGFLYLPMAMLAVVAWGGLGGALPHRVLPAIFRCLPGYLVVVVALVLVFVSSLFAKSFAAQLPFVGWLVSAAISLYLLMAMARLLGLLHRRYQERLGWN